MRVGVGPAVGRVVAVAVGARRGVVVAVGFGVLVGELVGVSVDVCFGICVAVCDGGCVAVHVTLGDAVSVGVGAGTVGAVHAPNRIARQNGISSAIVARCLKF